MKSSRAALGKVSLLLAIIAIALPFLIPLLFTETRDYFQSSGDRAIYSVELLAFILGVVAWRTLYGKLGAVLSIIISLALFFHLTISEQIDPVELNEATSTAVAGDGDPPMPLKKGDGDPPFPLRKGGGDPPFPLFKVITQNVVSEEKQEECLIISENEAHPDTYLSVFGPAPRDECSDWADDHCGRATVFGDGDPPFPWK